METKIKQEVEVNLLKCENYLETTSQHLFINEHKQFFKAFLVKKDNVSYCISLTFDGVSANRTKITEINPSYVSYYGNSAKSVLSHGLFLCYRNFDKRISIKNFKAMNEKVEEIKTFFNDVFDVEREVGSYRYKFEEEISKLLVGLEIKTPEK